MKDRLILRELKNIPLITAGIFCAGMGIHGFLLSSNFIDGGVTGISMLLSKAWTGPLSFWIAVTNFPFIFLGYRHLGKAFAIRSVFSILGLSLVLATVHFPDVTSDKLLTAVFGGIFIGAGIGLTIRGNAVLDGTEIVALLISKRGRLLKVGDIILIFNILLFVFAIYLLGIEPALYSILTYMAAARTLDFVVHGLEEFTAINIVSSQATKVKEAITGNLGRGVTIFKGAGGLSGAEQEILYCVVTKLEIRAVKRIVHDTDENAFITLHRLIDVDGGLVTRKGLY